MKQYTIAEYAQLIGASTTTVYRRCSTDVQQDEPPADAARITALEAMMREKDERIADLSASVARLSDALAKEQAASGELRQLLLLQTQLTTRQLEAPKRGGLGDRARSAWRRLTGKEESPEL